MYIIAKYTITVSKTALLPWSGIHEIGAHDTINYIYLVSLSQCATQSILELMTCRSGFKLYST